MENLIVTGAVVAFLLLVLPALVIPFLNGNPSTVDAVPRMAPDAIGGRSTQSVPGETIDRLAA